MTVFRPASADRLPAPWRLALALVASVLLSQLQDPVLLATACGAGALACGLIALARPSLRRPLLRRLAAVNAFVLLLWLTLPWSLQAGGPAPAPDGMALAQLISLRTNAIALACSALLAGLDAYAIARAAATLGLPPTLARLLALSVRYLALLDDTRSRIDRAMRARGFQPAFGRRSFAVLAQQVALVLVHALLRAERVELAMRARGFQPAVPHAEGRGAGPRWAWGSTFAAVLALALML